MYIYNITSGEHIFFSDIRILHLEDKTMLIALNLKKKNNAVSLHCPSWVHHYIMYLQAFAEHTLF